MGRGLAIWVVGCSLSGGVGVGGMSWVWVQYMVVGVVCVVGREGKRV